MRPSSGAGGMEVYRARDTRLERPAILPAKYEADLRHIALATIAEVDSLVSWNFKHERNAPVMRTNVACFRLMHGSRPS